MAEPAYAPGTSHPYDYPVVQAPGLCHKTDVLTIRDFLAAAALPAIIARHTERPPEHGGNIYEAYALADAGLVTRHNYPVIGVLPPSS